jgi:hypothetical protein
MPLRDLPTTRIARRIRRHRRTLAALFAGLSVLLLFTALRPPPPPDANGPVLPTLGAGEVGAPVTLANTAITSVVEVGDVVDVLSLPDLTDPQPAAIIATRARVIERSENGLLLLAVSAADAIAIATVGAARPLTITVHPD